MTVVDSRANAHTPMKLHRWCLLLLVAIPGLFWLLSVWQISAAIAPEQAAQAQLLATGQHAFAVDFRMVESLAERPGSGAQFRWDQAHWRVVTTAPSFDVRIDMRGYVLPLAQIATLNLQLQANNAQAKVARWWWVVYDQADQPGWIAALNGAVDHVDIASLQFANEADRKLIRLASELPPIRYMRLYGEAPIAAEFRFYALRFGRSDAASASTQLSPAWLPEAMLGAIDQARAQALPLPRFRTPPSRPWTTTAKAIAEGCWLVVLFVLAALMLQAPIHSIARARWAAALAIGLALSFAVLLSQLPATGVTYSSQGWRLYALMLVAIYLALWRGADRQDVPNQKPQATDRSVVIIGTLAMVAMLWLAFGIPERSPHVPRFLVYVGFVGLQQLLLQRLLVDKLLGLCSARMTTVISALLFALWHTPNFALMCMSFVAALVWCSWYQAGQRIWLLTASHVLLGWVAVATIPPDVLRNAEVGYGYMEIGPSSR